MRIRGCPKRRYAASIPLSNAYMLLFAMRFPEAFWVVYLRSRGMSFAAIGLLETVFHIASLAGEAPSGWMADRVGRKASLVLGRVLSVASASLILAADGTSHLILAFVLSALSYTCHSGAYDALVYDELKQDGRQDDFTRVMGVANALFLGGSSVAALVGGFAARRSFRLLYLFSIAVDLVALCVLCFLRERPFAQTVADGAEVGSPQHLSPIRDLRELKHILSNRSLAGLIALWAIPSVLSTTFRFYSQSYLSDALIPVAMIGAIKTAADLLAVIPSSLAYKLERWPGDWRPLWAGSGITALLVIAAGMMPDRSGLSGQAIRAGLFITVIVCSEAMYPLFSNAINLMSPSHLRATVMSAASMAFSVMMMGIFPAVGWCGDLVGLKRGFMGAGAAALSAGAAVRAYVGTRTTARREVD
ncbi:MAG: MFS transporter [Clostridia bacterium]|nr:MFS transporter [Clostridia bacterium]